MTRATAPQLNKLRNDPSYNIRTQNGKIIAETKQRIMNLPRETFTYDSTGKLISGHVRSQYTKESGNQRTLYGIYSSVAFKRQGDRIIRIVQRTKSFGGNVYRERPFEYEREVYTPTYQQISRKESKFRTKTQKLNLYRQGRLLRDRQGRYYPVTQTNLKKAEYNPQYLASIKKKQKYIPKIQGRIKQEQILVYDPAAKAVGKKYTKLLPATEQNIKAIQFGRYRALDERDIIKRARLSGLKVSRNKQGQLIVTKGKTNVVTLYDLTRLYSITVKGKPTAKLDLTRIRGMAKRKTAKSVKQIQQRYEAPRQKWERELFELAKSTGFKLKKDNKGNLYYKQNGIKTEVYFSGNRVYSISQKGKRTAIIDRTRLGLLNRTYRKYKKVTPPVNRLKRLIASPFDIWNFVTTLAVISGKGISTKQRQSALKKLPTIMKKLEVHKSNVAIVKDYLWAYTKNYPTIARKTFLTKDGLYKVFRTAASPFIGVYKSIEQVARDVTLTYLKNKYEYYYRIIPKTKRVQQAKKRLDILFKRAVASGERNRIKYKQDILNAMIMEGVLLLIVAGQSGAVALGARGATKAATTIKTTIDVGAKTLWRVQIAQAIIKPSSENIGNILPFYVIARVARQGVPVSFRRYLGRLKDKNLREITANIWKIGKVVKKGLGRKRLRSIDFIGDIKNSKVRKAFSKTVQDLKAVLYGSKIEYEAKAEYLKNVYSKLYNTKFTKKGAIKKFYEVNKKIPKDILDSLLDKPKDLDFVIQSRYVNSIIKALDRKYRYLPEMLQQYIKSKKWTKKMDLGLRLMRRDKRSVFSLLTKTQIDDLLRGLTTNAETTAFKLMFLENLYKLRFPKQSFRQFDLSGSGLENPQLKFKLDLHSDKEVAFTRKFLGFINRKQALPLEVPKQKKFKKTIFEIQKTKDYILDKKQKYLEAVANAFSRDFKRIGLTLNKKNFVKLFPKFLEKSEITNVKGFDFLETAKPAVNKKVLKAYQEAIDFIIMNTPSKLAKRGTISRDVKINILAQKLLKYSKKTARRITGFDSAVSELDARRLVVVYYSTGSRKLWNQVSKLKVGKFKLKKELSVKEQELLLKMIEKFDNQLQARFSDRIVKAEIKRMREGTKEIIEYGKTKGLVMDLGKTADRDLQLIKNFKTEKLIVTKDGKWSLRPREQIKRRMAGAISRIFESRRAKDMKKLYSDIKLIELTQRNILSQYNKSPLHKKASLAIKFKTTGKTLKGKIKKFKALASKVTSDMQRIESIYRTKGVSETVGLKDINFDDYTSLKGKKILKALEVRKEDVKLIEMQTKKMLTNKISKKQLYTRSERILGKRIRKAAEKKVIPRKLIRSAIRKLRSVILPIAIRKERKKKGSKSIIKRKVSRFGLTRSQLKSLSRSISKTASLIVSRSLSKSKSKSLSQSISRSMSKSASLSKSQSKSLSNYVSKSISKSVSRSKSKSKSRSRSRSRSISRSLSRSISKPLKKTPPPPIPPPFRLSWSKKLPRNTRLLVNPIVRVKGKNKELKWKTTPNRALRRISRLIDNTTSRSFQLKIVGLTKQKDVKRTSLKKFRIKRGKDKRVLRFVEKSAYAIDTSGEKLGLKMAKALRKKTYRRKKKR